MQADDRKVGNRDALLQTFAAELASAAYCVALRHGSAAAWVDLELDLWRALIQTVRNWDRAGREGRIPLDQPVHVCDPIPAFEDCSHLAGGG